MERLAGPMRERFDPYVVSWLEVEKDILRPTQGLVSGGLHEKRLLNDLLDAYNVLERPVSNESDPLVLSFGLTLMQIIDVTCSFLLLRCEDSISSRVLFRVNSFDNIKRNQLCQHKRIDSEALSHGALNAMVLEIMNNFALETPVRE
ncbi:hypothetical protein DBV15_11214 [Temnothorax longispinosus]|uniref:Neurotransmitter-gated ion-channel ligand-binding domain-containing protein n=1 Tax=Temnothorax longispinosus TaxID=300112 RepID=A0A4V3S7D9_9HYME|nr:hypothetical protein DBV15_11214 [Temnothorax longispinosus]